jgi:hypothetical protein
MTKLRVALVGTALRPHRARGNRPVGMPTGSPNIGSASYSETECLT